jgi:hypothetical protein
MQKSCLTKAAFLFSNQRWKCSLCSLPRNSQNDCSRSALTKVLLLLAQVKMARMALQLQGADGLRF